jgi:predicted DNA-binding protein (MmcQ/YjbR family)
VPLQFNVKCDPDEAIELRDTYSCVIPGYHMNKKHWNTVIADGSVSDKLLKTWIDASYNLVFESLPKKSKQEISLLK